MIASAYPEPTFDDLQVVALKPLLSLQAAAAVLGLDWSESHVRHDIKARALLDPMRIEWAWDIGSSERQQEIRVLASCVPVLNRHVRKSFSEVLDEIFMDVLVRHSAQQFVTVPGTFLARRLACTDKHVLALVADEALEATAASRNKVGRNGSPAITWASVVRFFQTRRIE